MSAHNTMATDSALSPEEKAAIDAMFKRLGGTYYEILGVPRGCDQSALRAAYSGLCGRFHPELFEGLDLGRYQTTIEAIFREITNAFEVLCRPDLRAIYDQSLPAVARSPQTMAMYNVDPSPPQRPSSAPGKMTPQPEVRPIAASTFSVGGPIAQSGPVPRGVATGIPDPPGTRTSAGGVMRAPTPAGGALTGAPQPVAPPEATPFRAPGPVLPVPGTLKRTPTAALINGGLSGTVKRTPTSGLTGSPSQFPPRRPSEPPDADTTRSSLARGRVEALLLQKRKAREELEANLAAATQKGDTKQVLQLLRHALTLAPDDEALQRRLQQAEAAAEAGDVDRLTQQAKTAERAGRWAAAAELWARAAALCPAEYSFHLYAAQAYSEAGTELPKAADLARKATRLRPDAVEAHVCLARVFFKSGRTASAKGAIEAALKLAPQNPAVIDLARQLRV